nr:nuclear transport factor 2 family protein [uncultured Carboxylicivirga sp.]
MKNIAIVLFSALIGLASCNAPEDKEVAAIKQLIETSYLEGTQNIGDMDKIDAGFHPDFRMQVLEKNGTLNNVDREGWKQMAQDNIDNGVLPRAADKQVSVNYLDIQLEKYAATLKMEYMLEGKSVYIDFMQLYKFPDGWKIVNKIYYTVGD